MTRDEVDQIPVGALLIQPQTGRMMVVSGIDRRTITVIQVGYSGVRGRQFGSEFRLPKPLVDWPMKRIA